MPWCRRRTLLSRVKPPAQCAAGFLGMSISIALASFMERYQSIQGSNPTECDA
jgi:hypothetical protein